MNPINIVYDLGGRALPRLRAYRPVPVIPVGRYITVRWWLSRLLAIIWQVARFSLNYPLFSIVFLLSSRIGFITFEWVFYFAYEMSGFYRWVFAPVLPVPVRPNDISLFGFTAWFTLLAIFAFYVIFRETAEQPPRTLESALEVMVVRTNMPFSAERKVDGSEFFSVTAPPFMARVEIKEGGVWMVSGVGFKTPHGFITAGHVVPEGKEVRVRTPTSVEEVAEENIRRLDIDVAVISGLHLSGMKSAKLSKVALTAGQREMVMVHNGVQASMGPVTESSAFGFCDYGGSTSKGFSGSPYYVNNMVLGMHVGAGAVNYGYEAAYLTQYLDSKESSEEWFLAKVRRGAGHKWRQSPFDPDEVFVKYGNRYVAVDRYAYEQAREEAEAMDNRYAEAQASRMAFGDEDDGPGPTRSDRKKANRAGKRTLRAFQLESAIAPAAEFDDESGNVYLPAAPVWGSAGQSSQPSKGIRASVRNMPITRVTESKLLRASPAADTAHLEPTPALRKPALHYTSSDSPTSTPEEEKKRRILHNLRVSEQLCLLNRNRKQLAQTLLKP